MAVALLNFLMLLNSMTQSQYSGTKEKSQLELICFTSSILVAILIIVEPKKRSLYLGNFELKSFMPLSFVRAS